MALLSTLAGLTGALTLAAGSPIALATPPVSVVACDYNSFTPGANELSTGTAFHTSNLRITFVNQAPLTATNVRFAVRYADRTQIIEDAGAFSSGTPITQDFTPATNDPYNGTAQCSVESVTFSDGSTWQPI
jgi:hypothetical protein